MLVKCLSRRCPTPDYLLDIRPRIDYLRAVTLVTTRIKDENSFETANV